MVSAVRRIVVLLLVVAAIGAVVLFLTGRPGLQRDDAAVTAAWRPVRIALEARDAALAQLDRAVRAAGPRRDVASDYAQAVARQVRAASEDTAAQIAAANELEGIGRRFGALVTNSPRYAASTAVAEALRTYSTSAPDRALVTTLDDAVQRANHRRDGVLRRLVARLSGSGDIPAFVG